MNKFIYGVGVVTIWLVVMFLISLTASIISYCGDIHITTPLLATWMVVAGIYGYCLGWKDKEETSGDGE